MCLAMLSTDLHATNTLGSQLPLPQQRLQLRSSNRSDRRLQVHASSLARSLCLTAATATAVAVAVTAVRRRRSSSSDVGLPPPQQPQQPLLLGFGLPWPLHSHSHDARLHRTVGGWHTLQQQPHQRSTAL